MEALSTEEKIIESAERLFAENGIAVTSLRKIVQDAGVNVASVNYHFGSKDGLIREVIRRRLERVNSLRLRHIERLREEHQGQPIPVDELMHAFLLPAIDEAEGGLSFFRMVARAHADTNPTVQDELAKCLQGIVEVMIGELSKSMPQASREEIGLRLAFCAGALIQAVLMPIRPEFMQDLFKTEGEVNSKALSTTLIEFCTQGMQKGFT